MFLYHAKFIIATNPALWSCDVHLLPCLCATNNMGSTGAPPTFDFQNYILTHTPDPHCHTRRGVKSRLLSFGQNWEVVEKESMTYCCLQIKYLVMLDVVCAQTTDLSALRLHGVKVRNV